MIGLGYFDILFYLLTSIMEKEKPKRQLTDEQLETLAKAEFKANKVTRKNYEVEKFEKEQRNLKRNKKCFIPWVISGHNTLDSDND